MMVKSVPSFSTGVVTVGLILWTLWWKISSSHEQRRQLNLAETSPEIDMNTMQQYGRCPALNNPPEETAILVLNGFQKYGRTANNLIELFHALHYGRDNNMVVGIIEDTSWATRLITSMWMAIQDVENMSEWEQMMEQQLCLKMFTSVDQVNQYKEVQWITTKDDTERMFVWMHEGPSVDTIEYQSHLLRTLWRSYNNGIGFDIGRQPVPNMCSGIETIFGLERVSAIYSVVHSRSFENSARFIEKYFSAENMAALEVEPEFVKSVLGPLDMLNHPIVFMTDNQRPEILERLQADPEIGPKIIAIPSEASWIGGDITLATMANVFIGNPFSSFSGFIVKSRVALGIPNSYMFRAKAENGTFYDSCDEICAFW
ncbi:hypothetical protein ACHAXH_005344 [Discostella pseudostelligera]